MVDRDRPSLVVVGRCQSLLVMYRCDRDIAALIYSTQIYPFELPLALTDSDRFRSALMDPLLVVVGRDWL